MKKVMSLCTIVALLFTIAYASGGVQDKEVKNSASLIEWIQTEDTEKFQYGNYHNAITALRENGEVLVVSSHNPSTISINTNGMMNYYGMFFKEAIVVHIKLLDENVFEESGGNYSKYFGKRYSISDSEMKTEEITISNGEKVDGIVYLSHESKYKDFAFVKDNFEVRISFYPAEKYNRVFLKNLSFELVSLSESIDLGYTDVTETDWHYEDVKYATFNEYIPGTSETTFSPNTPADRVTIASALYNTKGELSYTRTPDFVDVDEDNPYATAIWWAQSNGIINGVGDNKFNPEGNVTRQDFAVMLHRYMKYKKFELPETENTKVFSDDAKISDYAREAVYTLNTLGIMNGRGNDTIDPRGNVTRAEAAAMLRRMMKVK